MPYDASHLYLSIHWQDQREPNEGGQVGLRFSSASTQVTQAMVSAAANAVQTFWLSGLAAIPSAYKLTHLRLALIAEDGRYVPGTFSADHLYGAGISTSNASVFFPLQVASVATLTTPVPRGQASKGRIYLPPIHSALLSTGRWSTTAVADRATALATMLSSLNALPAMASTGVAPVAGVFSKGTTKSATGSHENVTGVKVGDRPDVQRRRAKSQAEKYSSTVTVTH